MKIQNKIRKIDPHHPEKGLILEAARIIRNGGVVIFPTQALYGLGTDPFNTESVDSLFRIKGRSLQNPILILIHGSRMLDRFGVRVSPIASRLIEMYWPGALTLIFKANHSIPENLTAGSGKIGIRWCSHPVADALIEATGIPITGTSANLSGQPGCSNISELDPHIAYQADMILDSGPLIGGLGSTIMDISDLRPNLVREGLIPSQEIFNLLQE